MRVRQARLAAGLSLANLAGDQVSRTFIHFVETGQSRPSPAVLEMIARRTGRPISYFLKSASKTSQLHRDLGAQLDTAAVGVRELVTSSRLTQVEREALALVETSLKHGAALARLIESRPRGGKDH